MKIIQIVYAIVSVSFLGLFFGIGLSIASVFFRVKRDERIQKIQNILPGLNCGACRFANCSSYAEKIAEGDVALNLCSPGGLDIIEKLSTFLGIKIMYNGEKKVAQVHCRGGKDSAKYAFEYNGLKDCNALFMLFGGNKICKYGCLGFGSCIQVCPANAISYDKQNLVWIDKEKCTGCGNCIEVCPTGVIKFIPYDADYFVACNSLDKGKITKSYCEVGFKIENDLAIIDYTQKGERENAARECPVKCIIKNSL